MPDFVTWLEATGPGVFARESPYGFQILVAIHLLGLIFSVGTLLWLDLRLAGVALRNTSIAELNRRLAPWFASGFVAMVGSGLVLFAGFATLAYPNLFFRIKLAAMLLAGINAWLFHRMLGREPKAWDRHPAPPAAVRAAGMTSLALWVVVIVCGRMMSYTMF